MLRSGVVAGICGFFPRHNIGQNDHTLVLPVVAVRPPWISMRFLPSPHMSITTYYQHSLGRVRLWKYAILPKWQHRPQVHYEERFRTPSLSSKGNCTAVLAFCAASTVFL